MNYGKDKTHYKFKCTWPNCGEKFEAIVYSASTGHACVSTQVKCPGCGNFLPNKSGTRK